jgi:hypothetical protein
MTRGIIEAAKDVEDGNGACCQSKNRAAALQVMLVLLSTRSVYQQCLGQILGPQTNSSMKKEIGQEMAIPPSRKLVIAQGPFPSSNIHAQEIEDSPISIEDLDACWEVLCSLHQTRLVHGDGYRYNVNVAWRDTSSRMRVVTVQLGEE